MPKKEVDYSNTIIYKICCKDETITDVYVGHTTNFIQRKYAHKLACNNLNNNIKIYNTIRCNGGWENWDMVEIAKYSCKDATEARIKEQEHYDQLKASLNSCPPYVDMKNYFCNTCNIQSIGPKQYNKHINSNKHIKSINKEDNISTEINDFYPKIPIKFACENCNFITCNKKDYSRHIVTEKHISNTSQCAIETPKNIYKCICGKIYKENSGLWRHKKVCEFDAKNENNTIIEKSHDKYDKLIEYLMKENKEIKELLLEVIKNCVTNNK